MADDRLTQIAQSILSGIDEINRMACPRCGNPDLNITLLEGNKVVIRCSEAIQAFVEEEGAEALGGEICDFVSLYRGTLLSKSPFSIQLSKEESRNINQR